jgi:hypothetical protein
MVRRVGSLVGPCLDTATRHHSHAVSAGIALSGRKDAGVRPGVGRSPSRPGRHRDPSSHDRQRVLLPLQRLRQGSGHRREAPADPGLPTPDQREGGTVQPHSERRVAHAEVYLSDDARAATYDAWLHFYNHHRPHTGIGGLVPAARVHNVTENYTSVARRMRHAACGMRHAACGMRHAACGKLRRLRGQEGLACA